MNLSPMGKCTIQCTDLFKCHSHNHNKCHEWFDVTMEMVPKNGKFWLQSLGLWSFTIIFYGRNTFRQNWRWDMFHSCVTSNHSWHLLWLWLWHLNKSVHCIVHLPMGDRFMWLLILWAVSHGQAQVTEKLWHSPYYTRHWFISWVYFFWRGCSQWHRILILFL
jgi:hypothetical protein